MTASLDDYRWLTDSAARPWLKRAADELAAGTPLVTLVTRLRRELPAERTHVVLECLELRKRAREKFVRADEMFFTPLGLAQATDETLARYKASRFSANETIADLCCGIGGDLMALGNCRNCTGVDRDPIAAHLARVNACVNGRTKVTVECRAVTADALAACDAWHIDPDRRPQGRRTVRTELFEPPWEVVETLLSRCGSAAVKLAPATTLAVDVAGRCEREWIESFGECRQQVAWFGRLARHVDKCAATVIDTPKGPATVEGNPDEPAPVASSVGRYVYEPCAAVRAARLTGALCEQIEIEALASGPAYLTSDEGVSHPLITGFEVLEALPFDLRRLKDALRRHGIGLLEVKKRGVDVDPDNVRRQLTCDDGEPGVVLITPVEGKAMAIVARRTESPT